MLKPMRVVTYFVVLFSFLVGGVLVAQNNQLQAYTLEDGLPQSQVYDIVQDSIGYLWLGTQGGGLARFDGENFKVWKDVDGLLSNYIHSLYATKDSLFIGSKQGITIKSIKGLTSIKSPQINKIIRINNHIYLATNRGVYKYTKEFGLEKLQLTTGIDKNRINDIVYDGAHFWIATNRALWKLSELTEKPSYILKVETNDFTALIVTEKAVFAATFTDGILIYEYGDPTKELLIREPSRIQSMVVLNTTELWVSTQNEGVVIIDMATYDEQNRLDKKVGLKVPHIRKVINDQQANIWIASSGGGFYKYFQNNFKHYNKQSGLKGNRVYAVYADKDAIWASNSEAGLVRIDSLGIQLIPQNPHYANTKIKTITADSKGNIWAGTDGRGILFRELLQKTHIKIDSTNFYEIQRDTIIEKYAKDHFLDTDSGFPSDWIRKIHIDKNTIWAATYSSGIVKFTYDAAKDSLVILKKFGKKEGIKDLLIRDMEEDSKGRIWYATKRGHLGYIQEDTVTHLDSVLEQSVTINSIVFHKNNIYLGTAGSGIWWSDSEAKQPFKKLTNPKFPFSNNCYQLIFDADDYLWTGTEKGVYKLELSQANTIENVFHFGRNEGFLGIETCLNAVTQDAQGNLWFGAIYGLTKYESGEITKTSRIPKVHFETIEVGRKVLDTIHLEEWTNNASKILQLNPTQTQLTFTYRTVAIDHPNAIQYRFKLNKTEWSAWSSVNTQSLIGLGYGAHSFIVQSRNFRWEESTPISFQFFIESPLRQKAWFQWMIVFLGVVIFVGIMIVYRKRVKAEQERLQMKNNLLSLEHKALQLQMNPHFIFNVLNGIKGMGIQNPDKMNTTINSFATLLREILYNSRKDVIALDQEIKTLRNYIEVELLMTETPFDYSITVADEVDEEEVLIPPMLVQPFVENAIRHGILKGKNMGKLSLQFYSSETFLYCRITDNGVGIFKSQQAKKGTDHQSMALSVTRERLESISGKDALQIKEIRTEDGSVDGTEITFKIPLLTDY
ncbi:MAG: two-component regulator propeller domain-containing protein [Cellulophaga sp.]